MQLLQEKGVHPSAPKIVLGFPRELGGKRVHPEPCRPTQQVLGAPSVPLQQPKARLAAPNYPARRPGLVGTSRGRLGSAAEAGRCRRQDWFRCLVCK